MLLAGVDAEHLWAIVPSIIAAITSLISVVIAGRNYRSIREIHLVVHGKQKLITAVDDATNGDEDSENSGGVV